MRFKYIPDLQDSSDGYLYTAGAEFYPGPLPPGGHDGDSLMGTPVTMSETFISIAAASTAGASPNSIVAVTSGGITINLLFDAAAMAAPASFRAGIQQAVSLLAAAISDPITVNIKIDYSGTGGGAAAGPDNGLFESYSSVKANLINHATPGDTTFNALPGGSSIQGQSNVAVWNAQLKLWGVLGANDTTTDDGGATFATDINPNLLVGVALHELTHALGRVPYGSPSSASPDIFDLFRFTSAGTRLFAGGNTAPAAYFSLDGGNTKLADFGRNSDPSDFLNSGVQGPNDPFNEFYTGSTNQTLTAVDKQMLDALGFHTMTPVTTVIESFGSTSLVQVGSNYFLQSNSTGAGPELMYGGAPVVVGQAAPWAPIGAEQTSAGYDVAWKNASTNQYSIWSTDSSGNFASNLTGAVAGTSAAFEAYETIFHQDLNGDGVIGVPATTTSVIESFGSTSLVTVGSSYNLKSNSDGTGPELKYGGAAVVVGQAAPWAPIGAEVTSTGYEVAWKAAGADQYSVWSTDSTGNFVSNLTGAVSGTGTTLESYETFFHQDLNGDGVTGIPGSVLIEAFGSTSLLEVGNNYFLYRVSGGTGPELQYGGVPVVAGQAGTWSPIGAEVTSTGFDVAWKAAGADQYSVWSTDPLGNFVSNLTGAVSGTSNTFETFETTFHQDLNGDGVIGIPGATSSSPSAPASQGMAGGFASNDTFVFAHGFGTGVASDAENAVIIGREGLFSAAGLLPPLVSQDVQNGLPQTLLQFANAAHDAVVNHDSAAELHFFPIDSHDGFLIK
jgi:hypothetical protein